MSNRQPGWYWVKDLIEYDPNTGVFTWLPKPDSDPDANRFNSFKAGTTAGHQVHKSDGRRSRISIEFYRKDAGRVVVGAHRLAWHIMTEDEPPSVIDHFDGDPFNNSWANLRDGRGSVNPKNCKLRRDSSSGVGGVSYRKDTGKWRAQLNIDGKREALGTFSTKEDAMLAVDNAKAENGYTARHGTMLAAAPKPGGNHD